MAPIGKLLSFLSLAVLAQAATKDQWRGRSIYQLITDRFAGGGQCDHGSRNYCGGNWRAIIDKLDYIQGMGFDAVWISPTALNIEGYTRWGEAYHGYWTADPTRLNPHFGTASDLKALSSALHARNMYLMVDIAINALASTNPSIDVGALASAAQGNFLFKDPANFHKRCGIQWENRTSEEYCWLVPGHEENEVALLDLATETPAVANKLIGWVSGYVKEYGIDGFRIDASKHMGKKFQHDFCKAAGIFCIGEVAGDNTKYAASYQGADGIDSVFGFGLMYGFNYVFGNGDRMDRLTHYIDGAARSYPDQSVIGSFLDNQDLPRINSRTGDKARIYNAIVGSFLWGGIPTVYYGLEQDIADGPYDPDNREALWNYNNYATNGETYKRIATLNKIRKYLGSKGKFHNAAAKSLGVTMTEVALQREEALIILTNRGNGANNQWTAPKTQFGKNTNVVDLLSCAKGKTDVNGALKVTFKDGAPFVWVTAEIASAGGFCGGAGQALVAEPEEPASATDIVEPTGTEADNTPVTPTSAAVGDGNGPSSITNPDATAISTASGADATKTTGTESQNSGSGTCKRSRRRSGVAGKGRSQ
ncbi:hypothetical protein IAT40_001108 [Kwoniella sp. CBS 6097]